MLFGLISPELILSKMQAYYRKEKVAEIQYAIVYVKATVEYEANQ